LTACATLVSESSSLECSSMNFRAFQISTGSARSPFCNLIFLDSCVSDIFITPKPVNAGGGDDAHHPLSNACLILSRPKLQAFSPEQFLQRESQAMQSGLPRNR
jgi:hypothetical protein